MYGSSLDSPKWVELGEFAAGHVSPGNAKKDGGSQFCQRLATGIFLEKKHGKFQFVIGKSIMRGSIQ